MECSHFLTVNSILNHLDGSLDVTINSIAEASELLGRHGQGRPCAIMFLAWELFYENAWAVDDVRDAMMFLDVL